MAHYLTRRLVLLLPMVVLISAVVFWAMRLIPVNPAELLLGPFSTPDQQERAKRELGLDKPIYVQYGIFLKNAMRGDFGRSIKSGKPVTALVRDTLPNTLLLGTIALLIAYGIAIPMGMMAAVRQNTLLDQAAMGFAMLGMAVPHFWLGLLLILVFAVNLHWFPGSGIGTWKHLVLPAMTLGLEGTALTSRMTRSSMLEVLRQDYVRVARAKGLRESAVIYRHALRNALIPIISLLGLRLGYLVGGAVVVEAIFAWPGIGRLLVDSILARDYPVVQGVLVMLGLSVIFANLLADVLYAFADPRVKEARH
jgi:peptide/nickel transport system permease protein